MRLFLLVLSSSPAALSCNSPCLLVVTTPHVQIVPRLLGLGASPGSCDCCCSICPRRGVSFATAGVLCGLYAFNVSSSITVMAGGCSACCVCALYIWRSRFSSSLALLRARRTSGFGGTHLPHAFNPACHMQRARCPHASACKAVVGVLRVACCCINPPPQARPWSAVGRMPRRRRRRSTTRARERRSSKTASALPT